MYNDYLTINNYEEIARAYSKILSQNNITYLKTTKILDENYIVNKIQENIAYFNIVLKNTSIMSNQGYINSLIKKNLTLISNFNKNNSKLPVFSTNKCESIKNILKNNIDVIKKLENSEKKYLINDILDISDKTINLFGTCRYLY